MPDGFVYYLGVGWVFFGALESKGIDGGWSRTVKGRSLSGYVFMSGRMSLSVISKPSLGLEQVIHCPLSLGYGCTSCIYIVSTGVRTPLAREILGWPYPRGWTVHPLIMRAP